MSSSSRTSPWAGRPAPRRGSRTTSASRAGVSGSELARSAMLQAVKFGARLVSPRSVTGLSRDAGRVPGPARRPRPTSPPGPWSSPAASSTAGWTIPGVAELRGPRRLLRRHRDRGAGLPRPGRGRGGRRQLGRAGRAVPRPARRPRARPHPPRRPRRDHVELSRAAARSPRADHRPPPVAADLGRAARTGSPDLTWRDEHRQQDVRAGGRRTVPDDRRACRVPPGCATRASSSTTRDS